MKYRDIVVLAVGFASFLYVLTHIPEPLRLVAAVILCIVAVVSYFTPGG